MVGELPGDNLIANDAKIEAMHCLHLEVIASCVTTDGIEERESAKVQDPYYKYYYGITFIQDNSIP